MFRLSFKTYTTALPQSLTRDNPRLEDPVRFNPDLAVSFTTLAVRLAGVGRSREALGPAEEAVALRRGLADPETGDPDRYAAKLAEAERRVLDLQRRLAE